MALFLLLLSIGYQDDGNVLVLMRPVVLDASGPSTATKSVKVGEGLVITLESNAPTGYRWELADELNESVVRLVKSEYQAPPIQMPGAGGKEVWMVKATGKGTATIALKYVRRWESSRPARMEAFTVVVD